ncbi:hypothetical protein CFOL_v3_01173, partial [Cephalotus follicularis]
MDSAMMKPLIHPVRATSHVQFFPPRAISQSLPSISFGIKNNNRFFKLSHRYLTKGPKASPDNDGIVSADDGVSLGTMKLPTDTDLPRFESLLFQWANSLCQGANLPLPLPLKVDKIRGGARLGFITIEDGKTEVLVYIDCLVFATSGGSGPVFRAIRNGPLKDKSPPGEPRIMRSLLQALKKSVEIAR